MSNLVNCFPYFSKITFYFLLNEVIYIFQNMKSLIYILIFFILFITLFFAPVISSNNVYYSNTLNTEIISTNPNGFVWPLPGYTRISSYFGKRVSPTSGASSSHSGIDIPAPEGTKFIAIADGTITFTQFLGAGGYTITLSFENYRVTYCHCSPNYIVKVGDTVKQGQVIGYVGPKYVYGVKGNLYSDSTGKPTNGATTGTHLHLGIRIDGTYQNPLNFF